jgi:hypothetical protein
VEVFSEAGQWHPRPELEGKSAGLAANVAHWFALAHRLGFAVLEYNHLRAVVAQSDAIALPDAHAAGPGLGLFCNW